jgi:Ser/Thr protein kinase RdoA (MazF antagonist)
MRQAVDSLLAAYGLKAASVRPVAQLDCDVYRITPARAAEGDGDYSLRIYPESKSDIAPIEAEVAWLAALADEGVHVPRPVRDCQGKLIQQWRSAPGTTPRHAVLLTWLRGQMFDRGLTPMRLHRVGTMTAHLHRVAAPLTHSGAIATPRLAYATDLAQWAREPKTRPGFLSEDQGALAREAAAPLAGELNALPQDAGSFGFVHGDLHLWNILFWRGAAGAIDFSDCGWGHRALDLASTLQYLKYPLADNHDHRAQYGHLQAALLDGYASVQALPANVVQQIDLYLIARLFVTLDWMLDDWPVPDHRAWGPGFLSGSQQVLRAYLSRC